MISVEESKKYLAKFGLTDKEVEQFKIGAYSIINDILDELYETETND
jgi:dGTP triphosphohydrolase